MATRGRARTILIVRRLVGLAFLSAMAVIGLYLFGREGRPEPPAAKESEASDAQGEFAIRGEGFYFAFTQGENTVFEIEGDEQRSDRDGTMFLTNVKIAVEREAGLYRVQAASAFYDPETHDAVLEKEVIVEGPEQLEVRTQILELKDGGDRLVARDGARFSSAGRFSGQADLLEAALGAKIYKLQGNVLLESGAETEQSYSLRARQVTYDERRGEFVAIGDIVLETSGWILSARHLELRLDEHSGELSTARFRGDVEGHLAGDGDDSLPLFVRGERLDVEIDPLAGERRRFELRGTPAELALVRQAQPDGRLRTLVTRLLIGELEGGVLVRATLRGEVRMLDTIPGDRGSARVLRAGRARATFGPQGELATATLTRNVRVEQQGMVATAERLEIDSESGELVLFGAPVKVEHARGKMDATRLIYNEGTGMLHGRGDVRTILEGEGDDSESGLSLAGGDGPIWVTSDEAFWSSDPDSARFVGAVRAWQGQNTLFADELSTGDGSHLSASGGVRTILVPDESDEGEDDSRPRGPIQIVSDRLEYLEADGTVLYEGSVHVQQTGSSLRCEALTLSLDDDNQAHELLCEGDVTVVDPESVMSLEGYRAIYDFEGSVVEVFGDPVTMKDGTGRIAEGAHHLIYGFDDNTLRLTSGATMAAKIDDD